MRPFDDPAAGGWFWFNGTSGSGPGMPPFDPAAGGGFFNGTGPDMPPHGFPGAAGGGGGGGPGGGGGGGGGAAPGGGGGVYGPSRNFTLGGCPPPAPPMSPPFPPGGGANATAMMPVCARQMQPSDAFQPCAMQAMALESLSHSFKALPPATSNCSATEGGEDAIESVALSFPCFQALVQSMAATSLFVYLSNSTNAVTTTAPVCPTPEFACNCFAVRAARAARLPL
jgi:hypothetical protein